MAKQRDANEDAETAAADVEADVKAMGAKAADEAMAVYPLTILFTSLEEKRSFNKALKELMARHGFETRADAARYAALKALEIPPLG
jgi:hypothetical protein